MANRSDFNSVLPRSIKRILTLTQIRGGYDNHQMGDMRRAFISAHATHKEGVKNRQKMKTDGIEDVEA